MPDASAGGCQINRGDQRTTGSDPFANTVVDGADSDAVPAGAPASTV
jgi:hypothetical protein